MVRYRVWFEETRAFSYVVEAEDRIEARIVARECLENDEEVEDEHTDFPEVVETEVLG